MGPLAHACYAAGSQAMTAPQGKQGVWYSSAYNLTMW